MVSLKMQVLTTKYKKSPTEWWAHLTSPALSSMAVDLNCFQPNITETTKYITKQSKYNNKQFTSVYGTYKWLKRRGERKKENIKRHIEINLRFPECSGLWALDRSSAALQAPSFLLLSSFYPGLSGYTFRITDTLLESKHRIKTLHIWGLKRRVLLSSGSLVKVLLPCRLKAVQSTSKLP